ncbi:MAG: glutamate--tRNA ligase [Sphingomonas fennica]
MSAPVTRFAPSPTGRLHVGNIRLALHNWLLAAQGHGRFLLRLDDTDAERSTQAFADAIVADLGWLGLEPEAIVRQSDRSAYYDAAFARLVAEGRVYPCYETPQELDIRRKIAAGRGLPPIYDRAALRLTEAERAEKDAAGIAPHWRFRLAPDPIAWDDAIRGPQRFDPANLSDPVVRRADGTWLYLLPSVIDDAAMGITHVLRGEDHVSNTALQIQMFEALGAPLPVFAHEALLVGREGKLSKRLGAMGADAFREMGVEPLALKALLARLGTSDPVEAVADVAALVEGFDLARFGRAPARFDQEELLALNARTIHLMDYDAVRQRLPVGMGAEAWNAIRGNLGKVEEAHAWWHILEGPLPAPDLLPEDRAYLATAAATLATLPWDAGVWRALTTALKAETGRTGKALFLPLRLALTGLAHGPDMAALLPLIARDAALARLEAAARPSDAPFVQSSH